MKNLIRILFVFVLALVTSLSVSAGDYSNGYSAPIVDGSITFKAELIDGKVHTKWSVYDESDTFKYYKIVRSQKVTSPVYPDHGYIKYDSNVNSTEYIDYKAPAGTNYYRVCAITQEKSRYCSNVVKIIIEGTTSVQPGICTMDYTPVCGKKNGVYKTFSNKCVLKANNAEYKYYGKCKAAVVSNTNSGLNGKLKIRANLLVNKLIAKLDKKDLTNEKKIEVIDGIIAKLEALAESKPTLNDIVDYLVQKLEEAKEKYENDFSEIEGIFDLD